MSVAEDIGEIMARARAARTRLWRPAIVKQIDAHRQKPAPVVVVPKPEPSAPAPRDILTIATVPREGLVASPSMRAIQREVCVQFNVLPIDMISQRRSVHVCFARQFAMWRCRRETVKSLPEIGRAFGGRDHTSVLHAVRKMDGLYAAGKLADYGFSP